MVIKILKLKDILGDKFMKDFDILQQRVNLLEKKVELLELKVQACEAEICSPANDECDCTYHGPDIEPCEVRGMGSGCGNPDDQPDG